jgi:hypothetical protein
VVKLREAVHKWKEDVDNLRMDVDKIRCLNESY